MLSSNPNVVSLRFFNFCEPVNEDKSSKFDPSPATGLYIRSTPNIDTVIFQDIAKFLTPKAQKVIGHVCYDAIKSTPNFDTAGLEDITTFLDSKACKIISPRTKLNKDL
ncbi:hypothetical protein ACFE04_005036 [Oxalis oulophora]